ncbi:MAG TPA: hypothetical protein VL400_07850 [Polyangiaceae bacterium]|nr:hypothetical protein [Polyangiaceae bacterium]
MTSAAVACGLLVTRQTHADEPPLGGEPTVMREPGEVVDVIDAFDGDDPIDVTAGLRFELDVDGAKVAREAGGGSTPRAAWSEVTSRLVPTLAVGLWQDFAVSVELPVILSRSTSLDPVGGAASGALVPGADPVATLPLAAPERSGIERVDVGIAKGIMNQARDRSLPTWMVAVELGFDVSEPMHACNGTPPDGEVACADPADRDRDGKRDGDEPALASAIDPGIARGTLEIALRTAISRRIRWFEPYGIFETSFEVPIAKSPLTDALDESSDAGLPVRGTLSFGLMLVPWENRERFARITLDTRLLGGFVTRGLATTEVFDALGASADAALRAPVAGPTGDVYESGVSVEAAHGTLGARAAFSWRASQIIRLGVGAGIIHALAHRITDATPGDALYRAPVDAAGARLSVEGSYRVSVSAEGAVLF